MDILKVVADALQKIKPEDERALERLKWAVEALEAGMRDHQQERTYCVIAGEWISSAAFWEREHERTHGWSSFDLDEILGEGPIE